MWLLKNKVADVLLKKWEDAGERKSRKRVSFCETVLRKRINAAGNAVVGEEKLRGPEEPSGEAKGLEMMEGVEMANVEGKENVNVNVNRSTGGKNSKGRSRSGSKGKR